MRTNIDIDDALVAQAQKVSGYATKTQTVEQALRLMIKRSDSARSRGRTNTSGAQMPSQARSSIVAAHMFGPA